MRSDIVPGGVFPDYALPDHTDTVRTLSELQGQPDWDLAKPGLRDEWDAGNRSLFHGWALEDYQAGRFGTVPADQLGDRSFA